MKEKIIKKTEEKVVKKNSYKRKNKIYNKLEEKIYFKSSNFGLELCSRSVGITQLSTLMLSLKEKFEAKIEQTQAEIKMKSYYN